MVNFVGAGPGSPDLITIRGKNLLENAEVIIYAGSLVNPELLDFAPKDCKIYNSATMTLDEVIDTIQEFRDKSIVRLHTGDPSIYGAIREQIDRLNELGIEYKVCPGVSSFCGAAAALGAELTLPAVSQTVILTRAAGRTPVPEKESIASLATHGATMVLFLSVSSATQVSQDLQAGGYHKDTPAAIVYKATWPEQKIVRGTVGDLAQMARGITKTALLIIGDVLGSEYELSRLYASDFSTE